MRIDVRPSSSRFVTRTDRIESRHSFSFGPHYDAANVGFGVLAAHNDDIVQPAAGFSAHPHCGVEIITWVVSGALRHDDDSGGSGVVRPGMVQWLAAGSGVTHSEVNAFVGATRYVQMWLASDDETPPGYGVAKVPANQGKFGVVASGRSAAPVMLRQSSATLFAARLRAGEATPLPAAPFVHLYLIEGAVLLGDVALRAGDAARVSEPAAALEIHATADSQLLAWAMDAESWRP